ncbi:MAG: GHKL domain-containing protein [Defluviitaleaceae bacterium]|nr:GHKL domain-containing protein [Defluviitaleaceae bacterium]
MMNEPIQYIVIDEYGSYLINTFFPYEILPMIPFDIWSIIGLLPHMFGIEFGVTLIFLTIYQSVFSPVIVFSFLFMLGFLGNKINSKIFHIFAIILAAGVTAVPVFYFANPGSIMMMNLAITLVMTVTVFILNFVKFTPLDYAILFSSFYYVVRFRSFSSLFFGMSLSVLFILIIVFAIYKIRLRQLKGHLFYCWFTCIFVFITGYGIHHLFWHYVIGIGQTQATRLEALIVWAVALSIVVIVGTAFVYALKRLLQKHFDNINHMGKTYPQIEGFFIYNSLAIIFISAFLYYRHGSIHGFFVFLNPVLEIFNLFLLFAMLLQLSFLIMIFRITWLKDNLKIQTTYSSNLEKNIDGIKNIKHDVKNIFLTMGNFVEQSGNVEMQEFYRKKISPFAITEIARNDLYSKLANFENEQLKAFLHYKIFQAIERGIDVELDVSPVGESPIEFIDLVRILGVFLDNAIEECMEISKSIITIKISCNNEMISYSIKNTVRPEVKSKGIRAGISTKGSNRGKGLLSVREIIKNYHSVMLNSYFSQEGFSQNLVIYK